MKAIVMHGFGGPEILEVQDRAIPQPSDHQVLIEVKASGINRPDIWQRKGHYPAPAAAVQDILGLEVAGIVVACGKAVTRWKTGDRICALIAGGGYAAYVTAHEDHCLPLGDLTWVAGACIPETLFTVWHNMVQLGRLTSGQRVLIHGGSGGIGTMGIQIAQALGAEVWVTASTNPKQEACRALGAKVIAYKEQDFQEILKDQPVNVILDSIGGPYFEKNLAVLAPDGYLVYINSVLGAKVNLNLAKLMQNRHHITGSTLRPRTDAFKAELCADILQNIWPMILQEQIKPIIHEVFPYEEVKKAHSLMDKGDFIGKLCLQW
jgi:NADPH2:quinone reductase